MSCRPDQIVSRPTNSCVFRVLLWGLRFYVIGMMALVAIQVAHAVQGAAH